MTRKELIQHFGNRRFAIRVPADCLSIILPKLDDTGIFWVRQGSLPSEIDVATRCYYRDSESIGDCPCLVIDPVWDRLSWRSAQNCQNLEIPIFNFGPLLFDASNETPVLSEGISPLDLSVVLQGI